MLSKLQFHLNRFFTWVNIYANYFAGKRWKKVAGIFLPVDPSLGFSLLRWIMNGRYEEGEIHIIRERLQPNDVVLEIGTGLGFIASYCSKVVGDAHVHSFEANPLNLAVAVTVFAKNGVHPVASNALLGEKKEIISFPVDRKNRLASSVLKQQEETASVPMLELNEEISRIQPTYLIMDIEGAEYDIIRIINFQSIRKVQMEIHPAIIGREKCNIIHQKLLQHGFEQDETVGNENNLFYQLKNIQASS